MRDRRIEKFREAIGRGLEIEIRGLLEADASLASIKIEHGGTPLHLMSQIGHVRIAELLIAHGADVNAEDENGFTPLQVAASTFNADVIRVLLKNGADVNAGREKGLARLRNKYALDVSALQVLVATMIKHRDMLKRIVETTDPDSSERCLLLETIQPTYSDPTQSVFALALAQAARSGVLSTLSPLIEAVQKARLKLYDLSIEWKRAVPPTGAWNKVFFEFNDAINVLMDHIGTVEGCASSRSRRTKLESIVRFPSPSGLQWSDVIIEFVADDSVKISVRGISKRYMFSEIGFKDERRDSKPDSRWAILKELAKQQGEISWRDNVDDKTRCKMKAAVKDIRKRLRVLMGIGSDPFEPYRKGNAYKTKFTLICRVGE